MFTSTTLKNGLQLILSPLKETKAVTVLVLLPVGSRYENPKVNGVSHFIEHLMFKGTKRRPTALDLTKALDAVGAEYNAFTAKDQTGYYIKIAADKMELAFDILSDMLFQSVFDETEINKERGVIIEEINMYQDNPMMFIEDVLEQTMFAAHPLGQLISGPRQVIASVPRSDIIEYKERFYGPANMVVSVAGNFKTNEVERLIKKYFGQAGKKIKKVGFKKITITQSRPRLKVTYKKTEQVHLCLGFPAYALLDPKIYALQVLSVILGGNMSSRLFTNIREKHGLAYFIRASVGAYQDTGVLAVQAGLDKSRIERAIILILEELKKIKQKGVEAHELKMAKEFIKGKLILGLEDSEQVADWLGKQQLLRGKILTPEQQIKKVFAVKQSDIKKAAGEIFKRQRLSLALIGPFKETKPFEKLLKL